MGVGPITSGVVPIASASVAGIVELATDAEAVAGTDTGRAVTPSGVGAAILALAPGGIGDTTLAIVPDGGPVPARPEGVVHVIWVYVDATTTDPGDVDTEEDLIIRPREEAWVIPISDLTTDITSGTAKMTTFSPIALTLSRLPVLDFGTGPTGTAATVDINVNGSTILSTKLTVDAGETSSATAATAAVLSTTSIPAHAKLTIDVDSIGTGARAGYVTVYYIAP